MIELQIVSSFVLAIILVVHLIVFVRSNEKRINDNLKLKHDLQKIMKKIEDINNQTIEVNKWKS